MLSGVIETPRLLLRRHVRADGADVLTMMRDAETRRWNPGRIAGHDVDDLPAAVAWGLDTANWNDGSHASFAFAEVETGRYAGSVSVHSIDAEHHDAEIGYRTAPWARGRGYAREAVTAATAWAFDNLALVRIELAHAVANAASCAVATRSGYALEGVLRQSFIYGDGIRYDEHLHARLVSDQ
jgi:RimJ/RimL family protein N-acetyltransferase